MAIIATAERSCVIECWTGLFLGDKPARMVMFEAEDFKLTLPWRMRKHYSWGKIGFPEVVLTVSSTAHNVPRINVRKWDCAAHSTIFNVDLPRKPFVGCVAREIMPVPRKACGADICRLEPPSTCLPKTEGKKRLMLRLDHKGSDA